jgi:hypothetical protein
MLSVPPLGPLRSNPSTARAARPPMSGGGAGVDGDDFGMWATNAPPTLGAPCRPFSVAAGSSWCFLKNAIAPSINSIKLRKYLSG